MSTFGFSEVDAVEYRNLVSDELCVEHVAAIRSGSCPASRAASKYSACGVCVSSFGVRKQSEGEPLISWLYVALR